MKEMPKYFAIKQCDSPLWSKYILWLNEKYNLDWIWNVYNSYYWYDGNDGNGFWKWANCSDDISEFENNPTILTLEEWDEIVNWVEEKVEYEIGNEYEFSNDGKEWFVRSFYWYQWMNNNTMSSIYKHIRPIKSNPEVDKAIELLEKEWYVISKK